MRARFLWLLLAASLGFNLFFGLGQWRSASRFRQLQTLSGRQELVTTRLGLDAAQRELFAQLWEKTRAEAGRINDETTRRIRADFWAELAREQPDRERMRALVEAATEPLIRSKLLAVDHMLEFMRYLRPEQRREYLELVSLRTLGEGP